jgi:hypothetical protein
MFGDWFQTSHSFYKTSARKPRQRNLVSIQGFMNPESPTEPARKELIALIKAQAAGLATTKGADGEVSTITERCVSRPMDS